MTRLSHFTNSFLCRCALLFFLQLWSVLSSLCCPLNSHLWSCVCQSWMRLSCQVHTHAGDVTCSILMFSRKNSWWYRYSYSCMHKRINVQIIVDSKHLSRFIVCSHNPNYIDKLTDTLCWSLFYSHFPSHPHRLWYPAFDFLINECRIQEKTPENFSLFFLSF